MMTMTMTIAVRIQDEARTKDTPTMQVVIVASGFVAAVALVALVALAALAAVVALLSVAAVDADVALDGSDDLAEAKDDRASRIF